MLRTYITHMLVCSDILSFLSKGDSDFRVTPIGAFTVTTFQTGSVQVLAEVDTVALEPVETFFVTMEIISNTIPANLFESRNTFLNDRIMVLIEDTSGKKAYKNLYTKLMKYRIPKKIRGAKFLISLIFYIANLPVTTIPHILI